MRTPAANPPTCAMYATPAVWCVAAIDANPFTNCSAAQSPIITIAGTVKR